MPREEPKTTPYLSLRATAFMVSAVMITLGPLLDPMTKELNIPLARTGSISARSRECVSVEEYRRSAAARALAGLRPLSKVRAAFGRAAPSLRVGPAAEATKDGYLTRV